MKIKVIVPLITDIFNEQIYEEVKSYAGKDVEIDVEALDYGTSSIESEYDLALAVRDVLNKAIKAYKEGFDGIYIDCFGEPGVRAAREVVDIPVVSGFEPAILLAAGLGDHLAIVTMLPTVLPLFEGLAKKIGLYSKVVSWRSVNIPVHNLGDKIRLENALYKQSFEAIEKNNAHVIVLGCTGMTKVSDNLHNRLLKVGYDVPVIDPTYAAIKLLEVYISMGLKQSRLTYMKPRYKKRK